MLNNERSIFFFVLLSGHELPILMADEVSMIPVDMIASLQQVANEGSANAADYVRHLVDSVADFVKDAPQTDDITLLAIKI